MTIKLERLVGPSDDNRGPAQGHGTEHGDTWRGAVKKINGALGEIEKALNNTGMSIGVVEQPDMLSRLTALESNVAEVKGNVAMMMEFFNDDPDATEYKPGMTLQDSTNTDHGMGYSGYSISDQIAASNAAAVSAIDTSHLTDAQAQNAANSHPGNASSVDHANLTPITANSFDGAGASGSAGSIGGAPALTGVDPATNEPVPANALRDNPAMLGSLAGAASGEGQIIGAAAVPEADQGGPSPLATEPVKPTPDTSGVEVDDPDGGRPATGGIPAATFDGKPGYVVGNTVDEDNDDNRFVASGATGQVVAEAPVDQTGQKPGQEGDPRPDGEAETVKAYLADREQDAQAKQETEQANANSLKPNVDPEQAVDDPNTPPSGQTLDRADDGALNNQRTF